MSYLIPQLMGQQPMPDYGYGAMPPPLDDGMPGVEHYADAARQVQAQALASLFQQHPYGAVLPGEAPAAPLPDAAQVAGTVAQQAAARARTSRAKAQGYVDASAQYKPLPLTQFTEPYPTRPSPVDAASYDTQGFRHDAGNLMGLTGLLGALVGGGGFMGQYGGQAMQAGVAGTRDAYDRQYQQDTAEAQTAQTNQDKEFSDQTAGWQGRRMMVQQGNADLAREETTRQRALYGPAVLETRLAKEDEATAKEAGRQELAALKSMNSADLALITGGRLSGDDVKKRWDTILSRNQEIRKLQGLDPTHEPDAGNFFDLKTQQGNQIAGALNRAVTVANSATLRQKQDEIFKADQSEKQRAAKKDELNTLVAMHTKIAGIQANATTSAATIHAAAQVKAADLGRQSREAMLDRILQQRGGNDALRATMTSRDHWMNEWQKDFGNVTSVQAKLQAAQEAKDRFDAAMDSDPVLSKKSPAEKAILAEGHNQAVLRLNNLYDKVYGDFQKNEPLYEGKVKEADSAYGRAIAIASEAPKNAATPTQAINPRQQNPSPPNGGTPGTRVPPASGRQTLRRDNTTTQHTSPTQLGGAKLRHGNGTPASKPAPAVKFIDDGYGGKIKVTTAQ